MNHKRQINRFYQGSGNFEQSKLVNNDVQIYKVTLKLKGYKGTWDMFPRGLDSDNFSKFILNGEEVPIQKYLTFNENREYNIFDVYLKESQLPSNVFVANPFIEEVKIHQGITSISNNFNKCYELKKVYIGSTVKEITSCFNECPILRNVVFEENSQLQKLKTSCFSGTEIDTLKLPDSVVDISGLNGSEGGEESQYKGIRHLKLSNNVENYPYNKYLIQDLEIPKTPKTGMSSDRLDYDFRFFNKLVYKGNEDYRIWNSLHLIWDSPVKQISNEHYCNILEFGNNAKTESISNIRQVQIIKNIPKTLKTLQLNDSYVQYLEVPNHLKLSGTQNINSKYIKFNGDVNWSYSGNFFILELGNNSEIDLNYFSYHYVWKTPDKDTWIIPNFNLSKIITSSISSNLSNLYLPDLIERIEPNGGGLVYSSSSDYQNPELFTSIYFPKNLKVNNLRCDMLKGNNPIIVFNSIPQNYDFQAIPSNWRTLNTEINWKIIVPEETTNEDKQMLVGENFAALDSHFNTFIWDDQVQYSSNKDILLRYNKNKKSFTIPNTVTRIISNAFAWSNIEVINIPASVQTIDSAAFYCCKNIKKFNVSPDNEYFCSVNGILYTKDMTELVCYPPAKDSSVYEVPGTVTYLRHMSLFYAYNIKKFISRSIPYIQHGIFSPQMNIENLELYNITAISNVFAGWEKLKDVKVITENQLAFSGNVFVGCSSLENVYIKCDNISDTGISSNYNKINFTGCYNLNQVELDYNYTNYSSNGQEEIFVGVPAKKIICPRIANYFVQNPYVEDLIITGNNSPLKTISGKYFPNLKNLYLPNLTSPTSNQITYYVWPSTIHIENNYEIRSGFGAVNIQIEDENYDKDLQLWGISNEEFNVPKKVKLLNFGSPSYCINKVNISEDSELEYLGLSNSTYNGQNYSRIIEKIYIPKNLSTLSLSYTLGACQVLDFEVDPENTNFRMIGDFLLNSEGKVIWLRPGITETIVPKEVKELTISILNVTFEENSQLTNLNISEYDGESLTVPESVTSLAVSNCPNLNNINFGENLTSLSVDTCPKLNTINLNEGLTYLYVYSCSELNNVNFYEGLTSLITQNCPKLDVIVPESVTSYKINDCKSVEFKNMIPFGKKTTSNYINNNQIKIVDGTIIKVPSCTIDEWKTQLEYDGITVGSECYSKETEDGTVCEDGKEYTNIRKEISKDNVDYTYLRNYRSNLISEDSENCPHIVMPSGATNLGNDKYRISINSATQSFTINTSDKIDSLNMNWTVTDSSSYGSVQGTIQYKIDDGEYTSMSFRDKNSETISNLGGSSHVITVQIKRASNNYYSGTMTISFTK